LSQTTNAQIARNTKEKTDAEPTPALYVAFRAESEARRYAIDEEMNQR
jgi:DNA-dependent RNA polymerase auxiliary subunit epsilon